MIEDLRSVERPTEAVRAVCHGLVLTLDDFRSDDNAAFAFLTRELMVDTYQFLQRL